MGGPPGDGTGTQLWRVVLSRGMRCLADGQTEAAIAWFERAYASAPDRAEVCFALGRERVKQGRIDEGARLLAAAWDRDRSFAAAAAALARCLGVAGGRMAEAHAVLDEALLRHPTEPGLHVVRTELLLREERGDEARASATRAADLLAAVSRDAPATRAALDVCTARTLHAEGRRLLDEGHAEQALFSFKRASDLAPGWSTPLVDMALAFRALGRVARARACVERALVACPDDEEARSLLASLSPPRA
jgi:Flp pilus assembly protein TadD